MLDEFTERFGEREVAFAVEATTGWRYFVEELERAGCDAHLAEPADTKALQGRKKRAKTDRIDAKHLRDLLVIERLPESWVPPEHIQEIRTLMRMRHTAWSRSVAPTSSASMLNSSTMDVPGRRRNCSLQRDASIYRSWICPVRLVRSLGCA